MAPRGDTSYVTLPGPCTHARESPHAGNGDHAMKKLFILAILGVGAWVGYEYSQTGSLPFSSSAPASAEEKELANLFDQFESARAEFRSGLKSAGLTGMDTTAQVDAAMQRVQRVGKSLGRLKSKLTSPQAKKKAARLEQEIKMFQSRLR